MADSLIPEDNQNSDREAILAKWKDKPVEELLNAKVESDLYIKSQNARFDDLSKDYLRLREEHQASTDLKTLIETLKKERENPGSQVTTPTTETPPAIKPEELKSLVAAELSNYQKVSKQQENFRIVQDKLKQTFGDNYVESYKQRLGDLGITPEFADDLAKNNPSVFIKTFDLEPKVLNNNIAPPRNQQRPTSFTPQSQKRDWAYYQELKKSNPKLYLDPKIAIQMHNDAIEQGAAFGMPEE